MAGYMAFIGQCNDFHPARRLPTIFLSKQLGAYTEHVRSNNWCVAVSVRVSKAQCAIFGSIHLHSDQNIMKYIAAVTSVTEMISLLIMTSKTDFYKKTGERTAIKMIIEGDLNGKLSYDDQLGMIGPLSNKENNLKGDAAKALLLEHKLYAVNTFLPDEEILKTDFDP